MKKTKSDVQTENRVLLVLSLCLPQEWNEEIGMKYEGSEYFEISKDVKTQTYKFEIWKQKRDRMR
jgi:hypothetical protein